MNVKAVAVRLLHRGLANNAGEALVRGLARYAPAAAPLWRKVAPQPEDYRPAVVRRARRRGQHWELRPHDYCQWNLYFDFDDPVLAAARSLVGSGDTVLDVGANVGVYACQLARAVGAAGRVHAFEPHPVTRQRLARNVALNALDNVVVVGRAVGAETGTAVLREGASHDSGKATLRRGVLAGDGQTWEVGTTTVDAYVAETGLPHLHLLKVDVEGLEPDVLVGAAGTLRAFRPWVLFELTPAWSDPTRTEAALTLLEALDYDLVTLTDDGPEPLGRHAAADVSQANLVAVPAGKHWPA